MQKSPTALFWGPGFHLPSRFLFLVLMGPSPTFDLVLPCSPCLLLVWFTSITFGPNVVPGAEVLLPRRDTWEMHRRVRDLHHVSTFLQSPESSPWRFSALSLPGPASPHLLILESLGFEVAQVTSQADLCEIFFEILRFPFGCELSD